MKTFGWILLVIGILNLIVALIALAQYPETAGTKLGGAIMFIVLGAFLIHCAEKKVKEKQDRDEWNK